MIGEVGVLSAEPPPGKIHVLRASAANTVECFLEKLICCYVFTHWHGTVEVFVNISFWLLRLRCGHLRV